MKKHGKSKTPEYSIWLAMRQRCRDPKHPSYPNYGGRGVTVCPRWDESFGSFLADVGPRPHGGTLDRIDPDKDYSPGNVRWATMRCQQRAKRCNRLLTFRGKTMCVAEWAEATGINQWLIHGRIRAGMSVEKALTLPPARRGGAQSLREKAYACWYSMKKRCGDPLAARYHRYGGRGIRVCDNWLGPEGFNSFVADMGLPPSKGHSLDRIDVDGDYAPGNCRWATRPEQDANTSATTRLTFRGETLHVAEWSRRTGLHPECIAGRLRLGWSVERALTTASSRRAKAKAR